MAFSRNRYLIVILMAFKVCHLHSLMAFSNNRYLILSNLHSYWRQQVVTRLKYLANGFGLGVYKLLALGYCPGVNNFHYANDLPSGVHKPFPFLWFRG